MFPTVYGTEGVRFLSIEPLLEDLGELDLTGIHWVIVGGESGAGARPIEEEWVLSIREQCRRANVPFFFKQWGGVRKSEAGRSLEGRTYDGMPTRSSRMVVTAKDRSALINVVNSWKSDEEPRMPTKLQLAML